MDKKTKVQLLRELQETGLEWIRVCSPGYPDGHQFEAEGRHCEAIEAVRDAGLFAPVDEATQRQRLTEALAEPDDVPEGCRYLTGCQVVLTAKGNVVVLGDPQQLGDPEDDEHPHSCDQMGCGSVGPHVLARGPVAGDAWRESTVRTLLSLQDELLCRAGTDYRVPFDWASSGRPDNERGSWEHEALCLVQSVLCGTADMEVIRERLAELQDSPRSGDQIVLPNGSTGTIVSPAEHGWVKVRWESSGHSVTGGANTAKLVRNGLRLWRLEEAE